MKNSKKCSILSLGLLFLCASVFPATVLAVRIPPGGGGPAEVYAYDFDFWGYLTSGGLSKTYNDDGVYFIVAPLMIPIPLLPPIWWYQGFIDFHFPNVYAETLILDYYSFYHASDVTIYYTDGYGRTYYNLAGGYREISLDSNRKISQITFRYWFFDDFFHLAEIKVDLLKLLL